MIARFFDKSVIIKKLQKTGNKKRFSSTATVDCNIQLDQGRRHELIGVDFGTVYIAYFDYLDRSLLTEGRLIVDDNGVEYKIELTNEVVNPITSTSYVEVTLTRNKTTITGQSNRT